MRNTIPHEYIGDIELAVSILKSENCSEVYIFGSLASGDTLRQGSDIDIAARGIPKERFFSVYGKLMTSLRHPVDLVDLDGDTPFVRLLESRGGMLRVA